MTVDQHDRPIIASWRAPGIGNPNNIGTNATLAPNATNNNPNRQYMVVYYDGTKWATSQVTNRTSDTSFDSSGVSVRDLDGRSC